MFELLYTSVSNSRLDEKELIRIQQRSKINNKNLNVTGMLVYYDREIMQLLEGEKKDVEALFQSIKMDDRHTSVHVFYQGEITERAFGSWSMEAVILDKDHVNNFLLTADEMSVENPLQEILKVNPNRGKKTFLSLRDTLY